MNMIYGGGGFGSRLMEEVREKRGLTYGIYSGPSYQNYTNSFRISSSTKNKSAAELIKIVRDEMLKMTEEIDEKEITKAKSYITGSLPLSMSSTDKIARIVQNLRLDNRETDYLDQFADNINAITAEDIKRVAKRILKPENMAVIIVGEPDNIEDFEILDDLPNVE
jgi:zinc protease